MITIDEWKQVQQEYVSRSQRESDEWYLECLKRVANAFQLFHKAKGVILDLGCGIGLEDRVKKGYSYLEGSTEIVSVDPEVNVHRNPFIRGVAENLPFRNKTFDTILIVATLDHLFDVEKAIEECSRTLKVGGEVAIFQKVYSQQSLDKKHLCCFTPTGLLNLVEKSFRITEIQLLEWIVEHLMFVKGERKQ